MIYVKNVFFVQKRHILNVFHRDFNLWLLKKHNEGDILGKHNYFFRIYVSSVLFRIGLYQQLF